MTGQRQEVPVEKFIEPPAPTRRLIVVNKPDAVQTEVRVGHVGIARKHPDYMAINLAIRILGGEGSNRLHNVLRTQRGLTYGAQADMDTLKESGDFLAHTNTRSAATAEVVRVIFDEFWRLQRDPVGERELADAKAYHDRQLPADDRDAGRHRDAGAQRGLLRPADRGAPELPRARQCRDGGRHPARRARVSPARPAVGRAGREPRGVRAGPQRRRLHQLRAGRAREPGSHDRRFQARRPAAPAAAAQPRLRTICLSGAGRAARRRRLRPRRAPARARCSIARSPRRAASRSCATSRASRRPPGRR